MELTTQFSYITGYEVIPGQGVTVGRLRWRDMLNVGHQSYGCKRTKEFSTSPQTDNWGKIRDWRNGIRGALKNALSDSSNLSSRT